MFTSSLPKILRSSAYATMLLKNFCSNKSLMITLNRSGLRMEPCDIPPVIGRGSEAVCLICTSCNLFE